MIMNGGLTAELWLVSAIEPTILNNNNLSIESKSIYQPLICLFHPISSLTSLTPTLTWKK
jgi:hypothetical protein